MKIRKIISIFFALVCILTAFGLFTVGASAADAEKTVYATTSASLNQGSYGYLYVYLDDLTDLSALNVSVHYDTEKITVKSVYNSVSSVINDLTKSDGQVNASYIFDGKGSATKTKLFYIYYQVNTTAEVGDTYFDIVVNEAYNSSLDGMDIGGSRCALEITEKPVSKSCSVSTSSNISTSVGEEFELTYRLSTYRIASGTMNIHYDPELFEVVSVTNGAFLNGKIADVNTALDGTVAISFVGTAYQYNYDVVKVRFKTLKNVTETSEIKLIVTDFYDEDLNLYSCSGCTTKASISFDESYTEDAPSMSVSSTYNSETGKVTATIKLEKDSMLGAGDFVFKFDAADLTYVSAEKGFSPTFFNINEKNVSKGVLKFSIISLSDITDEQIVLTVIFDTAYNCQEAVAGFEISGSGLTDSLVNTIPLNFVDSSITIPQKHTEGEAVVENNVNPSCTESGSYDNVIYCTACGDELSRQTVTVDALGHDEIVHSAQAPTCEEIGWNEYATCSRCDYTTYVEIPKAGHTHGNAVVENATDATCAEAGAYDSVVYCSACGEELSRQRVVTDKLAHTEQEIPAVLPTPSVEGYTAGVACSDCGEVLVAPVAVNVTVLADTKDPTFKIGAASLSAQENLSVNYKIDSTAGYTDVHMVFVFNGKEYIVTEYTVEAKTGRLVFNFDQTFPQLMADNIEAYAYAETAEGEYSRNCILEYSVKQYIINQLKKNDAALTTVMSDILYMGAMTQMKQGYKTDALVTDLVAAEGYTLTPSSFNGIPADVNVQAVTGDRTTGYDWKSGSLAMGAQTQVILKFEAADIEGLVAKLEIAGITYEYNVAELGRDGNKYVIYFDKVKSYEYNEVITATFEKNGEQVGSTLTYSINTFLQRNHENSNGYGVNDRNLMKALYTYGESILAYFG